MNLFILGFVLLGSSVIEQNAWAYKEEVVIADEQNGSNLRRFQMNRVLAAPVPIPTAVKPAWIPTPPLMPAAPRSPTKPLLPIVTPVSKPVAAPKKPVRNPTKPYKPSNPMKPYKPSNPMKPAKPVLTPSPFDRTSALLNATQPFKPLSPVQPMRPVKPLAKPTSSPFDGGINTAVNWYCGNQTAKTCSSQTCTDSRTGCSQNRNNYRDCLLECIPVPTAKPMMPSPKPVTSKPTSKPFTLNPILSPPFNGGINTPVDWYCGNETEKTCSTQTCSDSTGCSKNRNNYRSCLFECIGGTFAGY